MLDTRSNSNVLDHLMLELTRNPNFGENNMLELARYPNFLMLAHPYYILSSDATGFKKSGSGPVRV